MTVRKIFLCCTLFLGIIFAKLAYAGPWISSGGDLIGDSLNPWFVTNTPKVSYCFRSDKQSYSASLDSTRAAFREVLQFWQTEFAEHGDTPGSLALPLFIPQFTEVSCSGKENLTIILGEGALSAEEEKYIQSLKREVVALTVRTDYDVVHLRGRGFIFINGDNFKSSWVKEAWQQPRRLKMVLAHELGHVFGVPHLSGDANVMTGVETAPVAFNLMSEKLPETSVLVDRDVAFQFSAGIMPVLSSLRFHNSCQISAQAAGWFPLPQGTKCLQTMLFDLNDTSGVFAEIYAFNAKQVPTLLGRIKISPSAQTLLSSKFEIITQAVITSEQKVFEIPRDQYLATQSLPGGTQVHATLHLQFVPATSPLPARPVIVTLSPAQLVILGIDQNNFLSVFSSQRIRPNFN